MVTEIKGAGSFDGSRPIALKDVSNMTEFQMHLRWLAEQRRLQDLERRRREAERVALRELLFAADDDPIEDDDDSVTLDQNDDETKA
jgi:hypothetical protein